MSKIITALTAIFSVLLLLLAPAIFTENENEQEAPVENISTFEDCENIVSVPIIGIRSFAYCQSNSTVWTGEKWAEPTSFEIRRIEKLRKYSEALPQQSDNEDPLTAY